MNELELLRKDIDLIDDKIKELLILRMDKSQRVGAYKNKHSISIKDEKREQEIINRLSTDEKHRKLIDSVWKEIFRYSKEIQSK